MSNIFVNWQNTAPEVAWSAYIGENGEADVRIRKLNSGTVQVATGDNEWKDVPND